MIAAPTKKQLKKFSKYLSPDEEVICITGVSNRYFYLSLLYLFPLAILLVGFKSLIKLLDIRKTKHYILTNRRVIIRTGYFSYQIDSAPYDKISHLVVNEPFFHRLIFDAGDIKIHTTGPTPIEVELEKIASPIHIKNLIERLIIKERHLIHPEPEKKEEKPWEKLL